MHCFGGDSLHRKREGKAGIRRTVRGDGAGTRYPSNYDGVSPSNLGHLAGINDGDWAMYARVEFGTTPSGGDEYPRVPQTVVVVASSATAGGTIEVRLDSLDGQRIAEVLVDSTGAWNSYATFTGNVDAVSGQRDVFLLFKGEGSGRLFRIERFKFTADVIYSLTEESLLPTSMLSQNYPNPFGADGVGATTIEYAIQTPGHITLSVYNVLGQEVATLVDDFKAVGRHTVIFGGDDIPGGPYFYRLSVGGYSVVRVMTVAP